MWPFELEVKKVLYGIDGGTNASFAPLMALEILDFIPSQILETVDEIPERMFPMVEEIPQIETTTDWIACKRLEIEPTIPCQVLAIY